MCVYGILSLVEVSIRVTRESERKESQNGCESSVGQKILNGCIVVFCTYQCFLSDTCKQIGEQNECVVYLSPANLKKCVAGSKNRWKKKNILTILH